MPRLFFALIIALASGCATSNSMTCPAPIGKIVRDDCEQYTVRYDALGVTLGGNVAGVIGASVDIRKKQLQAPTELVQVMSVQATALCRDYNACRLSTQDYLRKREEMDTKYAVVAGIAAELKNPNLTDNDRAGLIDRLMVTLSGPSFGKPRKRPVSGRSTSKKRYPPRVWMKPLRPPPLPRAQDGFPILLHTDAQIRIAKYYPDWKTEERDGYIPSIRADLYGKVDPDDVLIVDFNGVEARCLMKRGTKGEVAYVSKTCKAPKETGHRKLSGTAIVHYEQAATGKRVTLGKRAYRILERRGDKGTREGIHEIGVDNDQLTDEAWVLFNPHPLGLPADYDQPSVQVTLRVRDHTKATMRCKVDGKPLGSAFKNGRGGSQVSSYQDKERYFQETLTKADLSRTDINLSRSTRRRLEKGKTITRSRSRKHPFIKWWRYSFTLPMLLSHNRTGIPSGFTDWTSHAGKWSCKIKIDGITLRRVSFTVKKDGSLEPHSSQRGKDGDIASNRWRVDVEVVKNDIEAELSKKVR